MVSLERKSWKILEEGTAGLWDGRRRNVLETEGKTFHHSSRMEKVDVGTEEKRGKPGQAGAGGSGWCPGLVFIIKKELRASY